MVINKMIKNFITHIFILLTLIATHSYAGTLTASVDRDTMSPEETFTLTLRYDEQTGAAPDYSLLEKDFDVLNTQQGSQMNFINGRMESFTEWKVMLAPKRTGKLFVPSFNIEGDVSDAIEITVDGKAKTPKDANQQVSVEVETSKESVHVQEQILVTIRLFTKVNLSGVDLEPLKIKDALVVQLDDKQYQTKINGEPGIVVETKYAVFPQQSGELVIPSILYQVSLSSGQGDLWDRFYGNRQNNILRLRTEEQKISVQPIPDAAASTSWQPATQYELTDHWSSSLDNAKVGEPITRTITIKAEGLTAGQIHPLQLPTQDGLTFYADQAQTEDSKLANGITGSRIETLAIVPTQEGRFTLPEIQVNWWDTKTNSMQIARLPAVTLNVGSGAMTTNKDNYANTPSVDTTSESPEEPATNDEIKVPLNTDMSNITSDKSTTAAMPMWLYITNGFILLLAIYFAAKYFNLKKKLTQLDLAEKNIQQQHINNEAEAWKYVKQTLSTKKWVELRKALINWAQVYWQDNNLSSLDAVSLKANNTELTLLLKQLDATIYGADKTALDSEQLLSVVANLRKESSKKNKKKDSLAPLYL
jgi:BatD DUF11 like domain